MKILVSIIFSFIISSFAFIKWNNDSLAFIDPLSQLKLEYQDDKCGEWGGDLEVITLYRESFEGELYADYVKEIRDCKNLHSERKKIIKQKVLLSKEHKTLVIEAINQLSKGKLSRINAPSQSGKSSQVMLTDSSIFIKDFPSIRWTRFEELRNSIVK